MHYFVEVLMFDGSFVAVFAVVAVAIILLSLKLKLLLLLLLLMLLLLLSSLFPSATILWVQGIIV